MPSRASRWTRMPPPASGLARSRARDFQHRRSLLVLPIDRNDDHLLLGQPRRRDQSGVVTVGHDEGADHPGRYAPRRAPHVIQPARRPSGTARRRPGRSSDRGSGSSPPGAPCCPASGLRRRRSARAPANRSLSVLRPVTTGMAIQSSMKRPVDAQHLAASPPPPPRRWRGRCDPPARGTPSFAGTAGSAFPSAPRCTTG